MTTRDSYLNKITILKNKKTLNWLVANKSAKSILSLIPIPFSTTTPVIWGVPSPSKKVVCYFGPFHRPSLALSGISPLHILLACWKSLSAGSQVETTLWFEYWGVMTAKTARFHFIWLSDPGALATLTNSRQSFRERSLGGSKIDQKSTIRGSRWQQWKINTHIRV